MTRPVHLKAPFSCGCAPRSSRCEATREQRRQRVGGSYALDALGCDRRAWIEPFRRAQNQKPKVHARSTGIIAVRAPVAQWIERRPPEPKVAGSNPVGRALTTCGSARANPCS